MSAFSFNELTEMEQKVFMELCWMDVAVSDYIKLMSVPSIAQRLESTKYQVRKCLASLKEKGVAFSGCESAYDEWNERYVIVRGFGLTDTARKTEEYKKAELEEIKSIEKCFGNTPA